MERIQNPGSGAEPVAEVAGVAGVAGVAVGPGEWQGGRDMTSISLKQTFMCILLNQMNTS